MPRHLRYTLWVAAAAALLLSGSHNAPHPVPPPKDVCWNALCRSVQFTTAGRDYGAVLQLRILDTGASPRTLPVSAVVELVQEQSTNGACVPVHTALRPLPGGVVLQPHRLVTYAFHWSRHTAGMYWVTYYLLGDGSPYPVPDASSGWSLRPPPRGMAPCSGPPIATRRQYEALAQGLSA